MGEESEHDYRKPPRTPLESARDRTWASPAEKMLTLMVALIVLAFVAYAAWADVRLGRLEEDLRDTQALVEETQTTTLENRAVSCRLMLAMGQTLRDDGPCYETEVLKFYDPSAVVGVRTENRPLLCHIAHAVVTDQAVLASECPETTDG